MHVRLRYSVLWLIHVGSLIRRELMLFRWQDPRGLLYDLVVCCRRTSDLGTEQGRTVPVWRAVAKKANSITLPVSNASKATA